jgi:hypothetical protein
MAWLHRSPSAMTAAVSAKLSTHHSHGHLGHISGTCPQTMEQ